MGALCTGTDTGCKGTEGIVYSVNGQKCKRILHVTLMEVKWMLTGFTSE